VPRGGGFFSRLVRAVRNAFTGAEEPPPSAPTPRESRDRQRARERNPYLDSWDATTRGSRTGFLNHKEIIDDLALTYDLDADDKREMWDDYLRDIVGRKGQHMSYRRNDIRNPFWQKWGIDPESEFDWHEWREAMGYPHGGRR
jgi:hypothetical protein